jgi:hypothetical protein
MHPYSILEHLVRDVVPERCALARGDSVRESYKEVLDDPNGTIDECKGLLGDWMVELSTSGKLRSLDEYVS